MRIVTKILTTLVIVTIIASASISVYLIQSSFLENPPLVKLTDESDIGAAGNDKTTDGEEEISDIRFYGSWERSDVSLNITDRTTYNFVIDTSLELNWDYNWSSNGDGDGDAPAAGSEYYSKMIPDYNGTNIEPDENLTILEGDYKVYKQSQKIILFGEKTNYTYTYSFSNNNNTLTLTNTLNSESYTYQRRIFNVNNSKDLEKYVNQKVNVTGVLSINNSAWANLTLTDQINVIVNVSNINYNFLDLNGETVSFNANILQTPLNHSWPTPTSSQNCSCYLSNIDPNTITLLDEQ